MRAGGLDTSISLCLNPIATLTRATLGQIGASAELARLVTQMMLEADAMASRLGVRPSTSVDERIQLAFQAGAHRMSMLQDLERERPLEFDTIKASFDDIRELARLPTPTLDLVIALMVLRATSA